ncbi:sn-glycerol-3-phosphate ABC transporter ATP-binding protein UgpC [bacterium]|nr:sn-glycerol-3-phosphate ABC transporter ATP-binding protein UgpC [bacterium]
MGSVRLVEVNKIYDGWKPIPKKWYEFWRPGRVPNKVHVVKGMNLDIKEGEFLVLVGGSGCGKSTTLRMIAGLEEITSGEIFIGDRKVNDVSAKDRDIAMVFQSYALYPHFTVFDNMAFGLRQRNYSEEKVKELVDNAADLLGIQHLLLRTPKELSGGQRQRVAMGRAIVRRPQVFLMDEPLSNLDAKLRVQMRAELQKLHRTLGVTTIYVTHDQTEAMTLGDRIVLMHKGIIQQADTPLQMYDHPANKYVAGFIGTPSMNFAEVKLEAGENGAVLIKGKGFTIEVAEKLAEGLKKFIGVECTLGLRPEDIHDPKFVHESEFMAKVKVEVEVYEPMGNEVSLHIVLGEEHFIARIDPHTEAKVGDVVEFDIDTRKFHLFDKSEEEVALL